QGTRDHTSASSDAFIAKALEFFGDPRTAESPVPPWDKGARLAQLVAHQRTLLVLDGLEPMQYPPGPLTGELRDPALAALLRGLAQRNPGLCVVTTREQVADLVSFRDTSAPEWKLERLSVTAGAELLQSLGIHGMRTEIEQLVRDVKGHALTLNLLGGFLARAHGGDVRKRDRVHFEKADANVQGGHAFKAMAAYERWLGEGGEAGTRQLAILRLLGLFDRPADAGCITALRQPPPIAGLTEPLMDLEEDEWNLVVASLAECGLVSWGEEGAPRTVPEPAFLDAHPLIREYFANQLRSQNHDGWRAAHSRLFDHLKASTEPTPNTLAGLQPLYQAVAHGCQAGRQQEARSDVYRDRIVRGMEFYSTQKLGAFGTDLGALACFFESPWNRVTPSIPKQQASWVLGMTATSLRALGRLNEALEPMRVALKEVVELEDWRNAAAAASNLTELEITLGEINAAVADGLQAVSHADRSGDVFQRMTKRAMLADALHQLGRRDKAQALFREAESIHAERQPEYPLLYSLQGFLYCDLLLTNTERAAWGTVLRSGGIASLAPDAAESPSHITTCDKVAERSTMSLRWTEREQWLLQIALDHLTLGRAELYKVQLQVAGSPASHTADRSVHDAIREHIAAAVDGLRRAGQADYLPRGLLTRAWLKWVDGDTDAAGDDLNEAWQIAERGPMRLHMADIHLYRARLFHAVKPYPWRSPREDLAAARALIEQCGYWRRKEELEDAGAAAEHW
ncbi:MAG TPA: hypothetical protein VFR81_18580, partial [Longimicrobium sp.]|nr:hypothetical protein [Longimicrobium sp.]